MDEMAMFARDIGTTVSQMANLLRGAQQGRWITQEQRNHIARIFFATRGHGEMPGLRGH